MLPRIFSFRFTKLIWISDGRFHEFDHQSSIVWLCVHCACSPMLKLLPKTIIPLFDNDVNPNVLWFDASKTRNKMKWGDEKKSYSFVAIYDTTKQYIKHAQCQCMIQHGWQMWRVFGCSSTLDIGIKMMRNKSAQPRIFFGIIPFFKAHWLHMSCFGPFISFSRVIWIYFISINNTRMPITRANNHHNSSGGGGSNEIERVSTKRSWMRS